uniref:Uncharacterized protein n=1 Tax=Human herpesvirus 1 TaxID=10298 RepID=A0A2Z4HDD8_HHV1|nr:hypothetical protein [Human alphaherpesvirus 1]AWW08401.1 hypothetical protein [Human alphaherpesvirus 1]AWW11158.1 hypothetical protein [Human alphaherpesvirus 1]AWW12765.1 hypothetical protein [Human alphaherpesvirus 1]AWW12857.1 hypothetical protein [Human alphaherpesvirus 1]
MSARSAAVTSGGAPRTASGRSDQPAGREARRVARTAGQAFSPTKSGRGRRTPWSLCKNLSRASRATFARSRAPSSIASRERARSRKRTRASGASSAVSLAASMARACRSASSAMRVASGDSPPSSG